MELWYTDQHTKDVRFSMKSKRQLASHQSEIQRIEIGRASCRERV